MLPLSVTIIAVNEADRIGHAIKSVAFADEILVVDSGSTDDTVAIAKSFGARVIETDWPGYREQKNRAAQWAKNDWILGLDADEAVDDTLAAEIKTALVSPNVEGFEIGRLGFWMGRPIEHGTWRPDRSIRLYDRRKGRWLGGAVHERVQVDGKIRRLSGDILHRPYRDLDEQLRDLNRYAELFVQDALMNGRKAYAFDVIFRPMAHVVKAIIIRFGFLDGVRGWMLAGVGAMGVMMKWGMLYLNQRRQ